MTSISEQQQASPSTWRRQPILLGCLALLVLTSTFMIGLGLGFGIGRLSNRTLAIAPLTSNNNASSQGRPADARTTIRRLRALGTPDPGLARSVTEMEKDLD